MQDGQERQATEQEEHLAEELGHLVAEHRAEGRAIRRQTRGELAGIPIRVEAGRQCQKVGVEIRPQAGDDTFRRGPQQKYLDEVEDRLDAEQPDQEDRDPVEHLRVPNLEGGIHEVSDHQGEGQPDRRTRDQRDGGNGQGVPMRLKARYQSPERGYRTGEGTARVDHFPLVSGTAEFVAIFDPAVYLPARGDGNLIPIRPSGPYVRTRGGEYTVRSAR